jgi:predicted nucleic acid-binding Zn ribbon protein
MTGSAVECAANGAVIPKIEIPNIPVSEAMSRATDETPQTTLCGKHRELTPTERTAIKKLVKGLCANYDREQGGCLLLDDNCYMFYGVAYTNTGMCKYFRKAVLPTDPILEAVLTSEAVIETRLCPICGEAFPMNGKQAYCTDACAHNALLKQKRDYIRKRRGKV